MQRTRQSLWVATLVVAGMLSACGSDDSKDACADANQNGLCDEQEPGHGLCDAIDRDADGNCTDLPPHCTGIQILRDGVCENCPDGDISHQNACVTPSVSCEANEIVVDEACVSCGEDATAASNECVPHCEDRQILAYNKCVDCPPGETNQGDNLCVFDDPNACGLNEIIVDDLCVSCGEDATATDNVCVPNDSLECGTNEIIVDDACVSCGEDATATENVCVPNGPLECGANEIIVDEACVSCGDDATATDNVCVPHCADAQILVENVCEDCAAGHVNDGDNACVPDGSEFCSEEESFINGACCTDLDRDHVCDDDDEDDCFGADNGTDADGDGFCADLDCDDSNPRVYPGAPEICGLPVVNDCDNPCYEDTCDALDLYDAKDGKVGRMIHGVVGQWSDITAEIVGPNKTYQNSNEATLYFCGEEPFHVYPLSTGQGHLHIESGLEGVRPTLSAFGEDRPVVSVKYQGMLSLNGVNLEHSAGFSGSRGHGVVCEQATVWMSNVTFRNNAATAGGGFHANLCLFHMNDTVHFHTNSAKLGGGMFVTGRTDNQARDAILNFESNTTTGNDSAALHVERSASVLWNKTATMPRVVFRDNVNADAQPRDIRVTADGVGSPTVLEIRDARFSTSGAGHVRTDETTHIYSVDVDLACTADGCTP